MAKSKKVVLSNDFFVLSAKDGVQYFVEEKPKNRWKQVAGPFNDITLANTAAQQYSAAHPGVPVRVVAFH